MEDQAVISHPPPLDVTDFGSCLAMPPLDDAFFCDVLGNNQNGDAMLEDLDFDFSFDDLSLPSYDLEELLSDSICAANILEGSDQANDQVEPVSDFALFVPAPGSGDNFESDGLKLVHLAMESDHSSNGSGVLNSGSPGFDLKQVPEYLDVPSPESNGSNRGTSGCGDMKDLNFHSLESQDSSRCGSHLSEESKDCSRAVSSTQNWNRNSSSVENCNENIVNSSLLKRKKECEVSVNGDSNSNLELRISKSRKSARNVENSYSDINVEGLKGDEAKKNARLIRNRESAQLSRQRKKQYVEELEDKVRVMHGTIQDLNAKISYFMAENVTLRQQIGVGSGNGAVPPPQTTPPHPGMLPHPAVMYPWMPSAPAFMMRPHGSQVPLVPIPRLKPQQPTQVSKTSKKVDNRKSEGPKTKTKNVAGVSFLGLLFFMVLFGCLAPMVNEKYGSVKDVFSVEKSYFGGRHYENHHGRVLMINGTEHGVKYGGEREYGSSSGVRQGQSGNVRGEELSDDEFVHRSNGSEPLMASLFVPRNNKLVKIDGNLIIHSVLASEKAMIFHNEKGQENGLAVREDLTPAIPASVVGINGARLPRQRALDAGSGSADKNSMNSKSIDDKLQQWFLEGPMLSSGMCTEVFRFDASPASVSGAIGPATSPRTISEEQNKNSSRLSKGRNRRILQGHPFPLSESPYNVSQEHDVKYPRKKNMNGNDSTSSVVVSVLVDPREGNDVDVDGVMGTKSLSRIFVVVLIDSVKYVTYSCILPFKAATSHL